MSRIAAQLKASRLKQFIFRFAPSPNHYCTLGHLKGLCLLNQLAKQTKGKLKLRFDDTNPSENYEKRYYNSYLNAFRALKIPLKSWTKSSNNLENHMLEVRRLLKMHRAYFCNCERQPTLQNTCTCYNNKSLQESVSIQQVGPNLKFEGTVRFLSTREPPFVILRRTKDGWSPTIALQGPVDDYLEGTTVVVRGRDLESLTMRQSQIYQTLYEKPYPKVYYWGRITLYDSKSDKVWVLSKSVKTHKFPSLKGLKDLGYGYKTLKNFLLSYGFTKNDVKCDVVKLNHFQSRNLAQLKVPEVERLNRKFLLRSNSFYFYRKNPKKNYYYWNSKTGTLVSYSKPGVLNLRQASTGSAH